MALRYTHFIGFLIILNSSFILMEGLGSSPCSSKDSICIMTRILESVLTNVEEINSKLANEILPQQERHSEALARMEKQVTEIEKMKEKVNSISDQIKEQQAAGNERRSVAIDSLSTQLKRQEGTCEKIEESVRSIVVQGQNISNELLAHDERLKAHDLKECKREEISGVFARPHDCVDIGSKGQNKSGVYLSFPYGPFGRPVSVFCDFSTPGDAWLVFQRRKDGSVNFERTWSEYAKGFGHLTGEFWIGNDVLHELTSWRKYKLRIDLEDFNGTKAYAEYSEFSVGSAFDRYQLTATGYSGSAGDSFSNQNGMKFSTKDSDNDAHGSTRCAQTYRGAWWYNACHHSNLNGLYLRGPHVSLADGIEWLTWHGYHYSLKTTEMKIIPVP